MTMDELMTEQRIEAVRRVDTRQIAFQEEALAQQRGGLRRAAASCFVRIGMVLDRGAVERAAPASSATSARNGGDDALAWHLR